MDDDEASKRAARMAQLFPGTLNLASLLASSRAARKAGAMPSREHVLEHLSALQTDIDEAPKQGSAPDERPQDIAPQVKRLLASCQGWSPSPEIPARNSACRA